MPAVVLVLRTALGLDSLSGLEGLLAQPLSKWLYPFVLSLVVVVGDFVLLHDSFKFTKGFCFLATDKVELLSELLLLVEGLFWPKGELQSILIGER